MHLDKAETLRALDDMCLMDDVFFSKCFSESKECTALLLRIILGRNDIEVKTVQVQRWIQSITGHSVRLDICAVDADGNMFDIEVQKTGSGAGSRRARYYSAMMDADRLGKGDDYSVLPESYVIFITLDDVFGQGRAVYEIERFEKESMMPFVDGAHIIYVNASSADKNTELGMLMHDLSCTNPDKMHYTVLRRVARYYKMTEEGVANMGSEFDRIMRTAIDKALRESAERGLKTGIEEGLREGMEKGSDMLSILRYA